MNRSWLQNKVRSENTDWCWPFNKSNNCYNCFFSNIDTLFTHANYIISIILELPDMMQPLSDFAALPLCIWGSSSMQSRCDVFMIVSKCLFVFLVCLLCLSRRWIRRIPRATAALQDLRFCCRNSWRGNRCRKRWPSSYEKGICFFICRLSFSLFTLCTLVTMKTIQLSLQQTISPFSCSFMYITVLHNTGNAHGNGPIA